NHLFVGVQADVAAVLRQIDLVAQLLHAGIVVERQEELAGRLDAAVLVLLEVVADGDDLDALGRLQDVLAGALAASAAADEADLDGVAAGGIDTAGRQEGGGRRGGSPLEDLPPPRPAFLFPSLPAPLAD